MICYKYIWVKHIGFHGYTEWSTEEETRWECNDCKSEAPDQTELGSVEADGLKESILKNCSFSSMILHCQHLIWALTKIWGISSSPTIEYHANVIKQWHLIITMKISCKKSSDCSHLCCYWFMNLSHVICSNNCICISPKKQNEKLWEWGVNEVSLVTYSLALRMIYWLLSLSDVLGGYVCRLSMTYVLFVIITVLQICSKGTQLFLSRKLCLDTFIQCR